MAKVVKAFFPGTFDPATLGHLDLMERAARLFDELVVGIYSAGDKPTLFSPQERLAIVTAETADYPNVQAMEYKGLTVDAAQAMGASLIIRGLRIGNDFEYERGMALVNRSINDGIETICLMSAANYQHISSSRVKEIAKLGGDITHMVTPRVADKVKKNITMD